MDLPLDLGLFSTARQYFKGGGQTHSDNVMSQPSSLPGVVSNPRAPSRVSIKEAYQDPHFSILRLDLRAAVAMESRYALGLVLLLLQDRLAFLWKRQTLLSHPIFNYSGIV